MSGLSNDGGINFNRKTNFGDTDIIDHENAPPKPKIDVEFTARQARLEAKLKMAKTVNYSGFAINGASIGVMLFGINNVIMDPNTMEFISLIESTFGIELNYTEFIELIEVWKTHLIGIAGSVQLGLGYYQQTRQQMKNMDTEDLFGFINDELGKII